jgi:cytochrome oxidase Cu insertion factor (SCO1/SenC/PrrC family)
MTSGPRVLRVVFAFAIGLLLAAEPARPQSPASASSPALPDVQKLGPQVGDRVPDFTLMDQEGQPRTLASLMGTRGLMLVFFRSADW